MANRNISGKTLEKTITSDDILGKEVIDAGGRMIGVVEKIFIDPVRLDILAIDIDKGVLKKGLTVGKDYIRKVTQHAIFLKISVAYEIKGMWVFDCDGLEVGRVVDINLRGSKNIIRDITVRRGIFGHIRIPRNRIDKIGENIFLNVRKTELNPARREEQQRLSFFPLNIVFAPYFGRKNLP